jgi:hypothetical protein
MTFEHLSKNKKIIFVFAMIFLLGGIIYLIWAQYFKQPEPVFCTQDAKLCPDGSYVGRTGPNCEFAICPELNYSGWKTFTDTKAGISFQYPETLPIEYIHVVDWPPQIQIINEPFVCTEGGSEVLSAGQTLKRVINQRDYCVTKESEGAAGSIYTLYAYATPIDLTSLPNEGNKTIIFTFSLRMVQCANYDDPQKTACENERALFNIDPIVDQIVKSLKSNL